MTDLQTKAPSTAPIRELWWFSEMWDTFLENARRDIPVYGCAQLATGVVTPDTVIHYRGETKKLSEWLDPKPSPPPDWDVLCNACKEIWAGGTPSDPQESLGFGHPCPHLHTHYNGILSCPQCGAREAHPGAGLPL